MHHFLLPAVGLLNLVLPNLVQDLDRLEAWREDILHLVGEMESKHPDLYFGTPREDFEGAVDDLFARLDTLSDEKIVIELMKLVGLVSREGRDGHSVAFPGSGYHYAPLRAYGFEDGWFVVAAAEPHQDLVGKQIQGVGRTSMAEHFELLAPSLTKDNDLNLRAKMPLAMVCTEMLQALGVTSDPFHVPLMLKGEERGTSISTIAGVDFGTWAAWGGLEMRLPSVAPQGGNTPRLGDEGGERSFWLRALPERRALYVQYNQVQSTDETGRSLADFGAEMLRTYEEGDFDTLVIDLRKNQGGNNTTFDPLIESLQACEALGRPRGLRALIGRNTFSAASNFVTILERETDATLYGEGTGGAPNQYGDSERILLPHHPGIHIEISTVYHQFSEEGDVRLTNAPDVAVGLTSKEYFAGEDPVLEAALRE
jgi:hypothetical protein